MKCSVFLNGRFVGFSEDGKKLCDEIREKRRSAEIDSQTNVAYYAKTDEVFINTDEGRARRPVLVLKNGKNLLTPELSDKIKKKFITTKNGRLFNRHQKQSITDL